MRLNPLVPVLKERQRYLVFEIISEKTHPLDEVVDAVWLCALRMWGDAGVSEFSFWIPANLYNSKRKRGVVKCNNESVEKVRSSLAMTKQIGSQRAIVHVIGTTGTIKSAKTKYLSD
ncbi:MAG: hypothetical protein KAI53_01425 [Candidatus Aenigmarchaeota archaeon]|nr:hypothetical protein [Candidatus Aenigmarchaeota archaeon]